MVIIPSGKEINRRPSEPPIGAQDAEELRRQHNIAVFRALAMPNQDHAPGAVDVRHSEPRDLRGPEPRRIGRAARLFRLDTDSRNRTISSALKTTGSLRGSRAYAIRSGTSASPSVTP
jgi:hypothetical protein